MNELTSISDGTSFTYDQLGNTLTKSDEDSWAYTYDVRNQLIQVEKNQQSIAQYHYDGNGRRVKKSEWSEDLQDYQNTICVYSGLDVIYEKDVDSGEEALYYYSPRGRIAKAVNGLRDFYHIDFLGSTRLTTDENGAVVSETQYKAFGETESNEKSHLFTGKEKDSSELYYFGSRYYDSDIGRFITRDTQFGRKSTPQSFNRYAYCLNNPLKYVDPDGRENASWLFDNEEEDKKVLHYSQAPQLIEYVYIEYDYTMIGWAFVFSGAALVGMGALVYGPILLPLIKGFLLKILTVKVATKIFYGVIVSILGMILYELILKPIFLDGTKFLYIEWEGENEEGYRYIDEETGETVKGERWINGKHQIWVHVPGEGSDGGHWEDDLDEDGVASSVDDDDNDPSIGDEDPNVP